jgi:thiamine biosynthesis lipoprotein
MTALRRMRPLLGCYVEVGARGGDAGRAIEAAFAAIEVAQRRWSFQEPDSELSRLNGSGGERVHLHAHTLRLLCLCRALMHRSGGHFDCTVGGLLVRAGALPDHGGTRALPRGRADDIEIGPGWARLRRPLRLTLDGIAKGFAVDLALRALRRGGACAGWINAGGDLRVFGDIALPVQRRELDGRITPLGNLRNGAIASTRAGAPDAAFGAHVVAPAGHAAACGVWSVLARSAWRADALAKVAATAMPARREALVRQLGGCVLTAAPMEAAA